MPNSLRWIIALAVAPHSGFFDIGSSVQVKLVMYSVTGRVTPSSVNWPSAEAGTSPWNVILSDLKLRLGNFSVLKNCSPLSLLSRAGIDRRGVDADVDLAFLCGAVDIDLAGGFVEAAALDRDAEVPQFE